MPTPKLIVISAPSGCGKTTIVREILSRHPEMLFSVSATTRPKRNGEIHGKDYFFITKEDFEQKILNGELIEWELIFGNYYGTLKSEVERAIQSGHSLMFDIDVKGALAIKAKYPHHAVLIFIEPPSIEALMIRLKNRKTESKETLNNRLERVPMELEKGQEFHYRVINDNLEKAIDDVDLIIREVTQT